MLRANASRLKAAPLRTPTEGENDSASDNTHKREIQSGFLLCRGNAGIADNPNLIKISFDHYSRANIHDKSRPQFPSLVFEA
jgi:hypothetical protein